MAFRVDVREDSTIEIMRPVENGQNHFLKFPTLESAMHVIKYFLRQDIERSKNDAFTPQLIKESRRAFRELEAKADEDRMRR